MNVKQNCLSSHPKWQFWMTPSAILYKFMIHAWFLIKEVNHIVECCIGWDASYVSPYSDWLLCVCVDHVPDIILPTPMRLLIWPPTLKLMHSNYVMFLYITNSHYSSAHEKKMHDPLLRREHLSLLSNCNCWWCNTT